MSDTENNSSPLAQNHTRSGDISKLALALSKAQGAMGPALKDAENPYFKSKYADLASVWEAIRKPLADNGLAIVQQVSSDTLSITVSTVLMHSSGQWVKSELKMKPVKNDPQSVGSCITYARRYDLSAMVGVAPEEDDGDAATQPTPTERELDKGFREAMEKDPPADDVAEWRLALMNELIGGKGKPFGTKIMDAKKWVFEIMKKDLDQLTENECQDLEIKILELKNDISKAKV